MALLFVPKYQLLLVMGEFPVLALVMDSARGAVSLKAFLLPMFPECFRHKSQEC